MIHNYLIKTNKEAILRFYKQLSKQMAIEIEWKKDRKTSDYENANSAIISYEGHKILEHYPYDTLFRAELAGDKEQLVLQVARLTSLVESPAGWIITAQLIGYVLLVLFACNVWPGLASFLLSASVASFIGLGLYVLGFANNYARSIRLVLTILFLLCLIPTIPYSIIMVFAGKTLNRRATYKLITRQ